MKKKNFYFIFLFLLVMILAFFVSSIKIYANPNIWISTFIDMKLFSSDLSQWQLEQSLSFPISKSFSLSALFGYSYYYEGSSGYKVMLGGTIIFPKSWYIDLIYGFYFLNVISQHEIFFAVNLEKNNWYIAIRQTLKFSENFFSSTTYIYSIYTFPNNYTFSVNSAIGFETGKEVSYALWIKSYLAFFPIFGAEIGASFAVEQNLFNFSLLLGLKFSFPIFSVTAFYQPFFAGKSGYSDLGFALVFRL